MPEDPRSLRLGNLHARVADGEGDRCCSPLGRAGVRPRRDGAAVGEPDRIVEQVDDNVAERSGSRSGSGANFRQSGIALETHRGTRLGAVLELALGRWSNHWKISCNT
jgi:hypothetical protein